MPGHFVSKLLVVITKKEAGLAPGLERLVSAKRSAAALQRRPAGAGEAGDAAVLMREIGMEQIWPNAARERRRR